MFNKKFSFQFFLLFLFCRLFVECRIIPVCFYVNSKYWLIICLLFLFTLCMYTKIYMQQRWGLNAQGPVKNHSSWVEKNNNSLTVFFLCHSKWHLRTRLNKFVFRDDSGVPCHHQSVRPAPVCQGIWGILDYLQCKWCKKAFSTLEHQRIFSTRSATCLLYRAENYQR